MSAPISLVGNALWKRRYSRLKKRYRYVSHSASSDVLLRKDARRVMRSNARFAADVRGDW